jgi:hypothetical protein
MRCSLNQDTQPQSGDLEVVEALPVATAGGQDDRVADELGLVDAVHGLRQRVAVRVTDRDRCIGTELGEPVRVGDGRALRPGVGVADQPVERDVPADPGGHLHSSRTRLVRMLINAFHPMIRREKTSVMKATPD